MGDNEKSKGDEAGFGARLFSGLKDLILEEDTPAGKSAAERPAESKPLPAASTPSPSAQMMPPPLPNSSMTKSLMEQVLGRQTAYTALTEAMTPLEDIIPDEMTRYRAAFAVIKKNRSLDQVIQAIELQHMQVLDDEMLRFASQAKDKEASDIGSRIAEANTLKGNIEAADVQAVKLREEMETRIRTIQEGAQRDRQRLEQIDREVNEKRQAIASVQRQFDGAAAAVRESLLQAKAKIQKYLAA